MVGPPPIVEVSLNRPFIGYYQGTLNYTGRPDSAKMGKEKEARKLRCGFSKCPSHPHELLAGKLGFFLIPPSPLLLPLEEGNGRERGRN